MAKHFPERLRAARLSAVHLEMRDSYTPADPTFQRWRRGERVNAVEVYGSWVALVREAVGNGVVVRRARIVSEPVSEYIRFEYETTSMNLAAGEEVRWLPRRSASDIALPGNDFWLLDGALVRFGHFAGDGDIVGEEWTDQPAVAELCATAFEAVWNRAVPHDEYKI